MNVITKLSLKKAQYHALDQQILDDIKEAVAKIRDEKIPGVSTYPGSPSCVTVPISAIRENRNLVLNAHFYNINAQVDDILKMLERCKTASAAETTLQNLKPSDYHPVVLEKIKEIINNPFDDVDSVLCVEEDFKGNFKRYAVTFQELAQKFDLNGICTESEDSFSFEVRPMWFVNVRKTAVNSDYWNSFFSDMSYELSEGDIENGNYAYIDYSEMSSKTLIDAVAQTAEENQRS